jgi:hypothetical protein
VGAGAKRKRDSAQHEDAKRKRDSAQHQDAKRKRDSAQHQELSSRPHLFQKESWLILNFDLNLILSSDVQDRRNQQEATTKTHLHSEDPAGVGCALGRSQPDQLAVGAVKPG